MDKSNINIFIISLASILLALNYWKILTISKGIFKVSGILFFKYFFRLLITLLFIYISISLTNSGTDKYNKNSKFVFVFLSDKVSNHDYSVNFKNFILNDLTKSDDIYTYNLVMYNHKKNEFYKILPDLKKNQLVDFINNNNLQNFNGFTEKLPLKNQINLKLLENDFNKMQLIQDQIIPIQNQTNSFINQIQSNNLNITFNLKVYLLFLLLIFLTLDILLSLKIIKI